MDIKFLVFTLINEAILYKYVTVHMYKCFCWIAAWQWKCWLKMNAYFWFWWMLPNCLPKGIYQFKLTPVVFKTACFPDLYKHFIMSLFSFLSV